MSVRKVKRPTESIPPLEANRATPRTSDPSVIESNRAEGNELQQQSGDQGGLKGTTPSVLRKGKILTVSFPSSSFAPVKYGSFAIPAVSMSVEPADDDDPELLVSETTGYLQKLQQELFLHELEVYVSRAKRAHKKVQEALGED